MIFNWHAWGWMTNLRGVQFGSWKLFDEIRENEMQKEDKSGWENIKVEEDKGETKRERERERERERGQKINK